MHISGIGPISLPNINTPSVAPKPGAGFKEALSSAIQEVEQSQATANDSVQKFLSGDGGELHSTIRATQRAEMEFDMFMQVRNKVVSAYQEIMRMQL